MKQSSNSAATDEKQIARQSSGAETTGSPSEGATDELRAAAKSRLLTIRRAVGDIRGYHDQHRTKLDQPKLLTTLIDLAAASCSGDTLRVLSNGCMAVDVGYLELFRSMAAAGYIPQKRTSVESWGDFTKASMRRIAPMMVRIRRKLQRLAPGCDIRRRGNHFTISLSPIEVHSDIDTHAVVSFDSADYVRRLKSSLETSPSPFGMEPLTMGSICDLLFMPHAWPETPIAFQLHDVEHKPHRLRDLRGNTEDSFVLIAGNSGQGKSTALRHLAWSTTVEFLNSRLMESMPPLPIYTECGAPLLSRIADVLTQHGGSRVDHAAAEQIIASSCCMFFIDDYDSLNDPNQETLQSIRRLLLVAREGSRVFITIRSGDVPALGQQRVFHLLSPAEPDAFLRCFGIDAHHASMAVRDLRQEPASLLLSTPLFLRFVAAVIRKRRSVVGIPRSVGTLIDKAIGTVLLPEMLSKPQTTRLGLSKESMPDVVGCLGRLAFTLTEQGEPIRCARSEAEECFRAFFKDRERAAVGDLARSVFVFAKTNGFLDESSDHRISFCQNTLRHYFAACHIRDGQLEGSRRRFVHQPIGDDRNPWAGVLSLLLGMVDNVTSMRLLEEIAETDILLAARLCSYAPHVPDKLKTRIASRLFVLVSAANDNRHGSNECLRASVEALSHLRTPMASCLIVQLIAKGDNVQLFGAIESACQKCPPSDTVVAPLCAIIEENCARACMARIGPQKTSMGNREKITMEKMRMGTAAMVLGSIGSDAALPCLRKMLECSSYMMRGIALWALSSIGTPGSTECIVGAIPLLPKRQQCFAGMVLGWSPNPIAVPPLVELLRHVDDPTDIYCLQDALATAASDGNSSPILDLVSDPPNDTVLEAAVGVLARVDPSRKTFNAILKAAERSGSPRLLEVGLRSLAKCRTADAERLADAMRKALEKWRKDHRKVISSRAPAEKAHR